MRRLPKVRIEWSAALFAVGAVALGCSYLPLLFVWIAAWAAVYAAIIKAGRVK